LIFGGRSAGFLCSCGCGGVLRRRRADLSRRRGLIWGWKQDRASVARGRIIDVTPAAAGQLGFSGLARVSLDVLSR